MRSPYDPLPEDIRKWAYQESALEPVQEWDLILSWNLHEIYLDLAGDSKCPNQLYFLRLLYFIIGNNVHSRFKNHTEDSLRSFIEKGLNDRPYGVHLWARRSIQLLENPEQFVYGDWCSGKLAMIPE